MNRSEDPHNEHLVDGLTDEIIRNSSILGWFECAFPDMLTGVVMIFDN